MKYVEGLNMDQFKRIDEISSYNYNFYVGFGKDLLFGKSDDDYTTEWYLMEGEMGAKYLGESYGNMSPETLHLISNR